MHARFAVVLGLIITLIACTTPIGQADRIASAGGLQPLWLAGSRFHHAGYYRPQPSHTRLWVFLDGDGSPWIRQGTAIATDPTPRNPLGLRLAAATPGSVLYLGRPCYFAARADAACDSRQWTDGRYGRAVVDSLSEVLAGFLARHRFDSVVLVGYSGGGTLAALVAPQLPGITAVVTIAGNLDTDAWIALHGYRPLTDSLNPALAPPLPAGLRQIHLVAAKDGTVPQAAMTRYLSRVPPGQIWNFAEFDHVCCWVQQWPSILQRLDEELRR